MAGGVHGGAFHGGFGGFHHGFGGHFGRGAGWGAAGAGAALGLGAGAALGYGLAYPYGYGDYAYERSGLCGLLLRPTGMGLERLSQCPPAREGVRVTN